MFGESQQKVRFSNTKVTNQYNLKQVIIIIIHHQLDMLEIKKDCYTPFFYTHTLFLYRERESIKDEKNDFDELGMFTIPKGWCDLNLLIIIGWWLCFMDEEIGWDVLRRWFAWEGESILWCYKHVSKIKEHNVTLE